MFAPMVAVSFLLVLSGTKVTAQCSDGGNFPIAFEIPFSKSTTGCIKLNI